MKTISLLLISLVFLPFSALATGNCITNTDLDESLIPVVDTEGNPLNKDTRYFVLPVVRSGVTKREGVWTAYLGDQDPNTCAVVRSCNEGDDGIAVYFKPKNPKQYEIVESSPVNIKFHSGTPPCPSLTVWKVDNYLNPMLPQTVSTVSKSGNPNSWFQIKKDTASLTTRAYKLVFCHDEKLPCKNVGIIKQNGYRRLALSDKAEAIKFKHDKTSGMAIA